MRKTHLSLILRVALFHFITFTIFTTQGILSSAYADCSCQKGRYGVEIVGVEYIASECPPDPPSDSHYYHYIGYDVKCPGSTIQNYAFSGDFSASPGGLCSYLTTQGYRVVRNSSGTHIIALSHYFQGTIAGVNFAGLTPGIYYADLDQICCDLPGNAYSCPSSLPEDLDNDGYSVCFDCDDLNPDLTTDCPVSAPDEIYNGRQACEPSSRFGNPVTFYNGNRHLVSLSIWYRLYVSGLLQQQT